MFTNNKQSNEKKPPIRKNFENEVQQLRDELLILGSMVEQQVMDAVDALKTRDLEAAHRIQVIDADINGKRYAIEEKVMIVIATQQPMAHDIRLLASILEVAGELERMGDYAKGVATITIRMGNEPLLKPLIDIPRMAHKGVDMLHRALIAFINEDVEVARTIPAEDDEVDNLYGQIYRELMLFVIQDPRAIERANYLLWTAHNLERLADRVTNICERTVFIVTGELKEIDSSK
ncbi:MAG: phosphate signaling complex protein PhoU [Anaerolineae bacterium]|nr:phosphate signaling complex protein PhoU [Anaerolineae bacterium]